MAKDWSRYRTDGCLVSDRAAVAPVARIARGALANNVDMRDKCSAVEDQMTLGSCSACATVGALELMQRKLNLPTFELSILFTYYNARLVWGPVGDDVGAFIQHSIAGLIAHGACEDKLWPYDVKKQGEKPTVEAYQNGILHEAIRFARADHGDALMQVLSDGFPVVFAAKFGHRELDTAATSGRMDVFTQLTGQEGGGHCMLIVGYDQAKREWLVRNSWGKDYGMGGYLWIPFQSLETFCYPKDFWVIGDLDRTQNVQVAGASPRDLVNDVQQNGADQVREAMAKLRTDLRKELQDDLEDAKKSSRSRLRDAVEGGTKRMADRDATSQRARDAERDTVQKQVDNDRATRGGGKDDGNKR